MRLSNALSRHTGVSVDFRLQVNKETISTFDYKKYMSNGLIVSPKSHFNYSFHTKNILSTI